MMRLLERLITKQIDAGIISEDEEELYRYGYLILFEWGLNLIIAGVIGLLMKDLQTTLIFLLSVIPLRSYAGGYHASTPFRCAVISNGALILVIGLSEWMHSFHLSVWPFLLCELILTGYYVPHVPVGTLNKPLSNRESHVYAIYARIIYAVEIVIMVMLYVAGREKNGITILLVHMFVVSSLLAARIQKKKNGK